MIQLNMVDMTTSRNHKTSHWHNPMLVQTMGNGWGGDSAFVGLKKEQKMVQLLELKKEQSLDYLTD